MPRLFVGTFLDKAEAERVANHCAIIAQKMSTGHLKLRVTKAQKMHLTWAFLGDTELSLTAENSPLAKLVQQLAEQVKPTQLCFDDLKVWQGVVVLTNSNPAIPFESQVESAKLRLKEFSPTLAGDPKKFIPHLTICRLSGHLSPEAAAENFRDIYPVEMNVDHVSLIESRHGDYIELNRWPLHMSG